MEKKFRFTVAVLAVATYTFGYGSIVGSFGSPGSYPDGIAPTTWTPGIIWVASAGSDQLYRCSDTGSVYTYFGAPGGQAGGLGSGFVGNEHWLWSINPSNNICYRISEGTGSVISTFAVDSDEAGAAYASSNSTLYTTRSTTSRLYARNALNGSIINQYNLNFQPNDLGFDSRGYLWIASAQRNHVYQTSLTGSVINSFAVTPGTPYGCDFAGNTVWVGVVAAQHRVYRYEVGLPFAVEPASMGRVKAMYR